MDRRRILAFALLLTSLAGAEAKEVVPPMFPSGTLEPLVGKSLSRDAHFDSFGNAWVTRGSGSPHVLYVSRRDIAGYIVSSVTPDGYLRVQRLGTPLSPLFDQFMVGRRVFVYTQNGILPAVVACPSTHFRRGADIPIPEATVDDLWIDVGAESDRDAENMGISLLDPVGLDPWRAGIGTGESSAGLGIGTAFLLDQLGLRPHSGSTRTIAIVSGSSEGGRGSRRLIATLPRPDTVYVFDTMPAPVSDSLLRVDPSEWIPRMAPGDTSLASRNRWAERAGQPVPPASWSSPDARAWATTGVPTYFVGHPTLYSGSTAEVTKYVGHQGSTPKWDLSGGERDGHDSAMRVLLPLLRAYGVSEHELAVAQAIQSVLPQDAADASRIDERGNLILKLGSGAPDRIFIAHQDEIGYRITSIDPDGRGRVRRIGGFFDWLYEGQLVQVEWGERGSVAEGLIVPNSSRMGRTLAVVPPREGYRTGPRPAILHPLADEVHAPAGALSRFDVNDVRIDPGPSREPMIAVGADVTVLHDVARLGTHRISARAIDDRYGCAALVMAAKELWPKRKSLPSTVWLVWSVEEEIGLRGATWLADSLLHHGMLPKRVHAVDTFVSSDSPLEDQRYGDAKLGQGAVVRAVDTSHEAPIEAVRATLKLAKEKDIPLQYGVTSGGNDGVPFAERGSINVPLAWPLRYAHSAVEVADLRDLESLARLIVALSREEASDDPARP